MATAIAFVNVIVESFRSAAAGWIALGALGAIAMVVVLGAAVTFQVRRAIRHRRVAGELRRVHEAAYRERFGHTGRLA